jgi:hypothetical protein
MSTMVTRSGRISKQPERFSPQERITDDYSDEDYSDFSDDDTDVSSAVSYSTDEGNEYVEDGFVERDEAPMDRTDDEWVPASGDEEQTEDDAIDGEEETFTDDEDAMKEAEELKKNYREKDSIVAQEDPEEEGFSDEDDSDMEEDDSDLIEGEEDFTDEEEFDDEETETEDEDDEESLSFDSEDESFQDVPIDPKESRKRVRKALGDKDDRTYLHELGVDPQETRNLGGVPMLPSMELNEGLSDEVDLTR